MTRTNSAPSRKAILMSAVPDKILVSDIDCVASIGVTPEERTMKQRLSVDPGGDDRHP